MLFSARRNPGGTAGRPPWLLRPSFRPMLEVLEDRITPSVVPSGTDTGATLLHNSVSALSASVPVNITAGNVTATFSSQAQTVTLTATAIANGAPLPVGAVFFTVTDSSGHVVGGNPVLAGVSAGSVSASFTIPAGQAPGTYTITATLSDPAGNYSNGTDTPGALIISASNGNPASSVPVNITAGNLTAGFRNQAQTVTLTATATANGAPLPVGAVFFTVTDSSGHIVGSPVLAGVSDGAASASFTIPAGQAAGAYTVTATLSDPAGNYSNGTDTPGTLTITPPSSGGSSSAPTPPTMLQAWLSLYVDGVEIALDQLLHQPTASVQADIHFQSQYAGPFGGYFELVGELAMYQAVQHASP